MARLVVDSIHGDIHLTDAEWQVVDTGSFQRLRHIKQLGMGHFTYPNATHTRFAHSLGVLGIMIKVLDAAKRQDVPLGEADRDNLRLAALLHDIGHYPYSHVMESIDNVKLSEELVNTSPAGKSALGTTRISYPDHVAVGRLIVTKQQDLLQAIGGKDRAVAVADLFTRSKAANQQISKLIHSSLDMDRLDYLLRDSQAAGVPYGSIDINYILNNIRASAEGLIGVSKKALPAVEQFLMARHFMHRAVYYHKTTVAMDEACRQLLRRLRERDGEHYGVPRDGSEVEQHVTSDNLGQFTDAFVDGVVQQAVQDEDVLIKMLASAIYSRRPPRLLKEVCALVASGEGNAELTAFRTNCRHCLKALAEKHGLCLGQFLFWEPKPLKFEERGGAVPANQARNLPSVQEEEVIKVFLSQDEEPVSIVEVPHSVMSLCAGHLFCFARLYFVPEIEEQRGSLVDELQAETAHWDCRD